MSIAPTLRTFLDQNVTYQVVTHAPTVSSMRTAEAAHVPGDCLAKGVVLCHNGGYMLAVLPASHRIRLADLQARLGDDVALAPESEIDQLFRDCAHGAVPPVGECYGLDVIIDDSIDERPDIYMEGGDHQTLIHMSHAQFARLMADAPHAQFSIRA